MSKYQPLADHLSSVRVDRVPMTFKDVETRLGFRLPQSARSHTAWWANTGGSHVHAETWRRAGWRTSGVDLASERVTFVREPDGSPARHAPKAKTVIALPIDALTASALKMVQEKAEGGDLGAAAAELLQELVIARRKALIDWFTSQSIGMTSDSVDLIREERDAR